MLFRSDSVGELVEKKALEQRRSASGYVALLVEADLRAAGLLAPAAPDPALAELIAKLQAVPADDLPAIVTQLAAALRRNQRPRRAATAAAA